MKVLLAIISPFLFSLCLSGQSPVEDRQADSLPKSSHGIGAQVAGSLLFYSIFYEYAYRKNSTLAFGVSSPLAIAHTAFPKNLKYGIGVRGFIEFWEFHKLRISLGYGGFINIASIQGKLDQYSPHDRPPKYQLISNLSIGYHHVFKKNKNWSIFVNAAINMIDYLKLNAHSEEQKLKRWLPLGSLGFKYAFK